jgi:hypothetical protein
MAERIFGGSPQATLELLRAVWPVAVGPEMARRSSVAAVAGRTLVVRVPDARWHRVMLRLRPQIVRSLHRAAGALAPPGLAFIEGHAAEEGSMPRPVLPPPPRPLGAEILDAAAAIPDEALRSAFLDAAARYLTRSTERP